MGVRIELPRDAWERVCEQADREWRTPKQQAEYLILRALGWEPLPRFEPERDDMPPAPAPTNQQGAGQQER